MKTINVINYHITNRCNYHCIYCFGKFDCQKDSTLVEAKHIIDNIASYFKENNISDGRINFAGGEPTLYAHLDELIDYAHSLDIAVSLITNGTRLIPQRILSWRGKVSCIGISIDSVNCEINRMIGRCSNGEAVELSRWRELSQAVHECKIDLKINTVVSRFNINEDLLPLYSSLQPEKIKLLQMHLVNGINDSAKNYSVATQEFRNYCDRYKSMKSIIISEPYGSMENSYPMISPDGKFQLNNNGKYQIFGDCNCQSFGEIMSVVPLDEAKFSSRYEGVMMK